MSPNQFPEASRRVTKTVRRKLSQEWSDSLMSRINAVVPFFPFNSRETHVVTATLLAEHSQRMAAPPTLARKIGNLRLA